MSNAVLNPLPRPAQWEPKFPFDLVIAFDDTTARQRAAQVYDHLAQQLLDDYDFQCSWWRIEHLLNPELNEQAADAAADANMVILSLRADRPLSAAFKAWLPRWLARKGSQKCALVVLLSTSGEPTEEARRLQSYLQQVARQARMDFFTHTYPLPREEDDYSVETVTRRATAVTPLLEEILDRRIPIPRWGINE
jgi:hypothetical protein